MGVLRAILFYLGMLIITPIFSILTFFLIPFNNVTRSRIASGWAHCSMFWLAITCGVKLVVLGRENIPSDSLQSHGSSSAEIGADLASRVADLMAAQAESREQLALLVVALLLAQLHVSGELLVDRLSLLW